MSDTVRAVRVYYLFRLLAPFAFALWLTIANLYHVTRITSDPLQLALVAVVLESATLFFEIPTGVVADVYSRKWSMVFGYVLWGVGFLIEGLFPTYGALLLSQLVWGIGFTFVSGAPEAWIVDEIGIDDAKVLMVRGSQVGQLASIAGIITATLIGTIDVALPIVVGGIATILLAVILAIIMPETGFQPAQRSSSSFFAIFDTFREGLKAMRGHAVLRSVVIIGIVIGVSAGGFDILYAPHIVGDFSIPLFEPVVWFGILNIGVMLFSIIILEIVRRYMALHPQMQIPGALAWFALGTILGNLVFAWTGNFMLAVVGFWVSQTLRNATKPLFTAWINQHTTSQVRATVNSMYWQSNAFGQIMFAPVIGWIGTVGNLRTALTISSLALSPVMLIYRKHRNTGKD